MQILSPKEAMAILEDMKVDIPVTKAAVTQIKRNSALDMAISALSCSEIPNSSDSISRQGAIDALTENKEMINAVLDSLTLDYDTRRNQEQRRGQINEDIETIKALPSAQPEQRWIPVREKLPEDEYVLISKKPTKLSGSKWSVTIAIRKADPISGIIHWRDIGFGVIRDDKVLAWRPLPAPYHEGEQDG